MWGKSLPRRASVRLGSKLPGGVLLGWILLRGELLHLHLRVGLVGSGCGGDSTVGGGSGSGVYDGGFGLQAGAVVSCEVSGHCRLAFDLVERWLRGGGVQGMWSG